MTSVWLFFRIAGPFAYGILLAAVLTTVLTIVTIAGSFSSRTSRAWTWLGALALAMSGVGFAFGGLGTWLARRQVDLAIASVHLDWATIEKLYGRGLDEARAASVLALMLVTLPWLLANVTASAAVLRAGSPPDGEGRPERTVTLLARLLSLVFAGIAVLGMGVGSDADAATTKTLRAMKSRLQATASDVDCAACASLSDALAWRGADRLEQDAPGAREHAGRCVDAWLANIDAGKLWSESNCESDIPPDEAKPGSSSRSEGGKAGVKAYLDAEAAAFRARGESTNPYVRELEVLLASPLLIDEIHRKSASERLAREKAKEAPALEGDPTLGTFNGGSAP